MPIQEDCRVLDHLPLDNNVYKLILQTKYIATHALPGQFAMVRVSDKGSTEPLLRRPISFHQINSEHGTVELVYEVLGKGTALLSQTKIGANVSLTAPLGNGFDLKGTETISVVVGGGMGIAPLLALAKALAGKGKRVVSVLGARQKARLIQLEEYQKYGAVYTCTDDGSDGTKLLLTDRLNQVLDEDVSRFRQAETAIYVCGPKIVLKLVSGLASQRGIPCQVSLEEKMACGIGACLGCAVLTTDGYRMVCKDGPVFKSTEIIWEGKA